MPQLGTALLLNDLDRSLVVFQNLEENISPEDLTPERGGRQRLGEEAMGQTDHFRLSRGTADGGLLFTNPRQREKRIFPVQA